MKLVKCENWHEASQRIGAYQLDAPNVEDAKGRMKRKWPGKIPHVCYWHRMTEQINRYYFCVEVENDK